MEVRPIRDEVDVHELVVAHARAWERAYDGLLPAAVIDRVAGSSPDTERVGEEFDRLAGYGPDRVLVALDDDGTVRGYAVFRWGDNETKPSVGADEAELKELYVDPAYWGRGFGTALLEAGIELIPESIASLALETLEGNDVAVGFYEARGFEYAGDAAFEVDGEPFPTRVYRRTLP